jgi:hypothetical protein
VCFVTFNYDTMLEEALHAVEIKIRTIDDYVASNDYNVFKVHGSVNWGRRIERAPIENLNRLKPQETIESVIKIAPVIFDQRLVSNTYQIMGQLSHQQVDNTPLFPALAIPAEKKVDFILPDYHLKRLKEFIPTLTKVLIIGWRATDAPFLELLKATPPAATVHIVSKDQTEGNQIAERMQHSRINAVGFFTNYSGFSNFLKRSHPEQVLMG